MRMEKKKRNRFLVVWLGLIVLTLVAVLAVGGGGESASIKETMRDAVLHGTNRISLFGLKAVDPAFISALVVSGVLLLAALLLRLLVIPRFRMVPGKLQLALEELVGFFDNLAKSSSPHRNTFLGAYVFAAGVYIFTGTLFELFGIQAVTTGGVSVSLPAPLSDINGAIALGCLSYLVIMSGGIAGNGVKGIGLTLKDFSLPVSMSFRLFGALLSGLLVTELVYYYIHLSFVLPVAVGVMFTLLHALIQTYVLTMLTALFYGEVTEPAKRKVKEKTKLRRKRI
jgi:F-type H+-transporting ATPase subunit a